MVFATMLKGIEDEMSEKVLSYMYWTMRIDVKNADWYCGVPFRSEPYVLQEDKYMKYCKPLITAYVGEIVCDAVFLNPVPNAKYWFTKMNK